MKSVITPLSLFQDLRSILRRDVLTICLIVFVADCVNGIVLPTFSLYAQDLGASLSLIGLLGGTIGLTQLFASLPIGIFSDKLGSKPIVTLGMVSFAAGTLVFVVAPNPYFLFPGRVLIGLAWVMTFTIAIVYIADIVVSHERGLAYGLYATSMGIGFAVGPLVGAAISVRFGLATSYLFAVVLALGGAGIARWGLPSKPLYSIAPRHGISEQQWGGIQGITRDPNVVIGSLANFIAGIGFNGVIANFFPIYLSQLHIPQLVINSIFSIRA